MLQILIPVLCNVMPWTFTFRTLDYFINLNSKLKCQRSTTSEFEDIGKEIRICDENSVSSGLYLFATDVCLNLIFFKLAILKLTQMILRYIPWFDKPFKVYNKTDTIKKLKYKFIYVQYNVYSVQWYNTSWMRRQIQVFYDLCLKNWTELKKSK